MTSYSRQAASWLLGLDYDDLPSDIVADAKLRILDIIGLALAATASPIGMSVREAAIAMGTGDDAHILGFGDSVPAANAALANGTLAHAMDFDDTHMPSIIHCSGPIVATALAVGETAGASGKDLIAAVAAGNELTCRLGLVAPGGFHAHGFHPTGVIGTLTAAMIAGRMLGLDTDTVVNAVGIAGSQGAGLLESFSDGTWVKTLHPGWAAHSGIAAALLARAGFTGPATIVEGRFGLFPAHIQDPDATLRYAAITDGLGTRWEAPVNAFKPYPCAHAIHPYVDAALAIQRENDLDPAEIESIELPIAEHLIPVVCEPSAAKRRPRTPTHARASLVFAVAAALWFRSLRPAAYMDEAIRTDGILSLIDRIAFTVDPDPAPHNQLKGRVMLKTRAGQSYDHTVDHARGSGGNPMSTGELEEKFRDGAAVIFDGSRADQVIATIHGLDSLADIGELTALCIP